MQSVPISTKVVRSNPADCPWFYPSTPVSSTNITDRHDITEMFSSISYIDLHFCLSRFGILCLSYKLFFHFQHCILFLMSYTSQDVFNQELINVHIKLTTIENSRKKMKTNLVMPCHIVIFSYGVETADFGCPV